MDAVHNERPTKDVVLKFLNLIPCLGPDWKRRKHFGNFSMMYSEK